MLAALTLVPARQGKKNLRRFTGYACPCPAQ